MRGGKGTKDTYPPETRHRCRDRPGCRQNSGRAGQIRGGIYFTMADKTRKTRRGADSRRVIIQSNVGRKKGKETSERLTGVMASIEPFTYLTEYRTIVCKTCRFGCVAQEAATHLKRHHDTIDVGERNRIAQAVKAIPSVLQRQADLVDFQFPAPTSELVPFIAPPQMDGIKCKSCPFVARQRQRIQEHCRRAHGWENPERRGRVARHRKQPPDVPWVTGIRCQRFFPTRIASGWFEVARSDRRNGEVHGPAPDEDPVERVKRLHREQVTRFKAKAVGKVQVGDDKTEPNGWLERTGWAKHLKELDVDMLRRAADPIRDDEAVLQRMWEILERVLDQSQATAEPKKVGSAALFEAQRKDVQVKPRRPFDNRLEDDTWARYKEVWRKLLSVWWRMEQVPDDERPPYRLTKRQGDLFDAFEEAVVESEGQHITTRRVSEKTLERMCLDVIIASLDHQLKQSDYDNVIISGLAVLGVRDDGGWVSALDYTPIYSAVIKTARMMVVYQSYWEREDEIAELVTQGFEDDEARERAEGMFSKVRARVQRFMTTTSGNPAAQPTPMDWIFETRSYGLHIRYNTPTSGSIDWKGEQITHRGVRFTMSGLSEMLHTLVDETRDLLAELACVESEGVDRLPRIEWRKMEDDHSEDRVGYSFLTDERNEWLGKGEGWVLGRIEESRSRSVAWFPTGGSPKPYREEAIRRYGRAVEQFRERLWMLVHMTSGQPGRSTEISGIRFVNTANGGVRNILAHDGMMCFVTSYHKGFRSTGQAKVIHRYMPREVGELLVWYLWLILPFWQQVQGIVKEADVCSPFLWADEIVGRDDAETAGGRAEPPEAEPAEMRTSTSATMESMGEDAEASQAGDGFEGWIQERKWTLDRVRRIMQRHGERLLGNPLNVSAWRHIAIAIANRYLGQSFSTGEGEGEEDDGVEDNPVDLQAGHGTHVAGMVYARLLQQGAFGTASRREQFRGVSQRWHRLLGFGADDAAGSHAGAKRGREPIDQEREEVRWRRFARLQRVDVRGELTMMMGATAEFRGQQEVVIRAVMKGESPIVQVAGTGGGKSMTFMLPAFCAAEGTTIVIVPLVSLREDLYERCARSEIESHVWKARQVNRAASIVFVTPESAVTKGFRDFVNRLQSQQRLDRVVVDECHVLLDGDREFRPQLSELGSVLRDWGVQRVFLTATLAPADEESFFKVAGIEAGRVRMFRSRTTRKNVAYRVETVRAKKGAEQEKTEDEKVCGVVRSWLNRHESGRAIVYAGTIERVERLADALKCERYHSKVDTAEGKATRLRVWLRGGTLVVATNALGLGVDVPDVRLVVHAGMPRRMRDYAQESGRAGRDGCRSQAVVVCGPGGGSGENRKSKTVGPEEAVGEFTGGKWCRRVVLDRAMDGRLDRSGCEEGEEECDVCATRRWEETIGEEMRIKEEEKKDEEEGRRIFSQQVRRERYEQWSARELKMQEAEEADRFRRRVEEWAKGCPYCRVWGNEEHDHDFEECGRQEDEGWIRANGRAKDLQREVFDKKRMERFSGCFGCGMPQAICRAWKEEDGDEGRYVRVCEVECQRMGLLTRGFATVWTRWPEEADRALEEVVERSGSWRESGEEELYRWLGSRVKWGGFETSRFCQVVNEFWGIAESSR